MPSSEVKYAGSFDSAVNSSKQQLLRYRLAAGLLDCWLLCLRTASLRIGDETFPVELAANAADPWLALWIWQRRRSICAWQTARRSALKTLVIACRSLMSGQTRATAGYYIHREQSSLMRLTRATYTVSFGADSSGRLPERLCAKRTVWGRVGIVGGWGSSCLQTLIFEWKSALNFNPWAKFQTFRHLTHQLF